MPTRGGVCWLRVGDAWVCDVGGGCGGEELVGECALTGGGSECLYVLPSE